jgi:hypothetical protein
MRKLIIFFLIFVSINIHSQIKNGRYIGLEKINIIDNNGQWYHQNTLSIRNDSVYLYKVPICITKKDTIYSAADYGFYYYAGLITKRVNKNYISIFQTDCDYCITEIFDDSLKTTIQQYKDTITYRLFHKGNYLIFNNVKYKYNPSESYLINNMDFKNLFIRIKKEAVNPDIYEVIDDK